mgnify:CR=1 FL=1|jgi:transcriptional regulator with XRE-family HTH domain
MKKNALFEQCLANVAPEVQAEVSLNIDIANRINDLLREKNMTQRELAKLMGKKESEISRWLTGSHGFTTKTIAKISTVLGKPVVEVKCTQNQFVLFPFCSHIDSTETKDGTYEANLDACQICYIN